MFVCTFVDRQIYFLRPAGVQRGVFTSPLAVAFGLYLASSGNGPVSTSWVRWLYENRLHTAAGFDVAFALHRFHPQLAFHLPACGRNIFPSRKKTK